VPRDLSVLVLGAHTTPVRTDIDFTGFRIPRREMGRRAVELLTQVLESGGAPQEMLPCELVEGSTLAPVQNAPVQN
jgi:DNA-binding LacI/PurR family transcriptional regulator